VEYVGIFQQNVKFHYISSDTLPQLFQLPPPFQCTKLLPYAGIFLLFLTLLFCLCLHVSSISPSFHAINLNDYSLEEVRDIAKKNKDDRFLDKVEKYAVESGWDGEKKGRKD
jgi:hypothetical protein